MAASDQASEQPLVSVIVPARNEEVSLRTCLESLVAQEGITFELIVVDDNSTDRTREIAESFAKARVVDAGPLPPNWTGKNNAMTVGARQAKGKWLLFTDADTVHKPRSLARAVAEGEEYGAALLSYSPDQEVRGFWEKAVMPVIFAELAATYPPKKVNDPASPIAAANGQYLLISREAYDAVGGHAAISGNLLEDVALARLVKTSGRRLRFRYGGDAVRTYMYRGFRQLREGWTKNLALLFSPAWALGCWRLAEFTFIAIMIVASAAFSMFSGIFVGALQPALLALIVLFFFWFRIRAAHFSVSSNMLAILGLPIFAYLLFRSGKVQKRGAIEWKGRTYPASHPAAVGSLSFKISGVILLLLAVQIPFFLAGIFVLIAYGDRIFRR